MVAATCGDRVRERQRGAVLEREEEEHEDEGDARACGRCG